MKKTLLAALAAFPLLAGAADLAPGTVEVSGATGLALNAGSRQMSGASTIDSTQLSVDTATAYFVIPNVGIGLGGGYLYENSKTVTERTKTTSYSVGPVLSAQLPLAPQLALFARGSVGLVRATSSVTMDGVPSGYSYSATFHGWAVGAQAGLKYFPAPSVSLDAGAAWSRARLTGSAPAETISNLGVRAGVSVYFGGGR